MHDNNEAFERFWEAENECKTNKKCIGVLDMDCKGQQKYYLCSEKQESNNAVDSCIYRKFMFGEIEINFIKTISV